MLIKVLTRKSASYGQLIDYLFRDQAHTVPILMQNFRGTAKDAWIRELAASEASRANRRKDNVALYHEIMSFHQGSTAHLTDDKLRSLAYEYAKTRNPNAHVIASVHRDTDHVHVHFLVSGTEHATGKATRLSMADLRSLKERMQEIQRERYPELSDSLIDFERYHAPASDREFQLRERAEKPLTKDMLQVALTDSFAMSLSRKDFQEKLKDEYDIDLYERNGQVTGISYNNRKFRFSTLDFDPSSLAQLDATEVELAELESLRAQPTQGRSRLDEFEQIAKEEVLQETHAAAETEPEPLHDMELDPAPEKDPSDNSLDRG